MAGEKVVSPEADRASKRLKEMHPAARAAARLLANPHVSCDDATRAAFAAWEAGLSRSDDSPAPKRVALLKQLVAASGEEWQRRALTKEAEPDDKRRKDLRRVVLESNLAGIEEFGEDWFYCISAKMDRMNLCADYIILALSSNGAQTGFDAFERALIVGCARIKQVYDAYYFDYLNLVQNPEEVAAIKANPPVAPEAGGDAFIFSHYTAVAKSSSAAGRYTYEPFAVRFRASLAAPLREFDRCIAAMKAAEKSENVASGWSADQRQKYVKFMQHYRECLACENIEELEAKWTDLDRFWMDCKAPIQVVHDIETGYGDPLRVKATPDMSLRFLDDSYQEENATIADIQQRMMAYYRSRKTPLSRAGLSALANTLAGIYFIPFKTGISLQFSFSGQSIPNRVEVQAEKGVKIYFDAIETAARVAQNETLVRKVFDCTSPNASPLEQFQPDAVEQLVWHVASHEVGHAIYNLRNVANIFSNSANESLLEEPRAELTAMFTLRLLHTSGRINREELDRYLAHFVLDGLRYFAKYKSEALRPYIIFQIYCWKTCERLGYLTTSSKEAGQGLLRIEATKTLDVLDALSDCFERLLAAMDSGDGTALEKMLLEEMAPETNFIKRVVEMVNA